MSKEKILRDHNALIEYSEEEWAILKNKRDFTIKLLEMFANEGLNPYVYGSIARGNTHEQSDVDIIFIQQISPFQIEYILEKNGYTDYYREIIMATPKDAIKLYIHLSEMESITVPITKLTKDIMGFYDFGGKVDITQLKSNIRVPGIDKRLVFIKPNKGGHEELSVIGNESVVAKELGLNIKIIDDRIKVLLRREKHGRTGVFIKRPIGLNESTEQAIRKLAKSKSIIRRKIVNI